MKVIIPTQHEAKHFRRIELPEASAVFRKIWDWAEMAGGVGAGGAELDVWLVMVLTASRPGETIKMLWPWVNFEKALITHPASAMKTKREHITPLSTAALHVLRRRERVRSGEAVFTSLRGKAVSNTNLGTAVKRTGNRQRDIARLALSFRRLVRRSRRPARRSGFARGRVGACIADGRGQLSQGDRDRSAAPGDAALFGMVDRRRSRRRPAAEARVSCTHAPDTTYTT